jgi:hypothetical protein
MIKDKALWQAWEEQTILSQAPDFQRNLRLLEAMYEHARALANFTPSDPLAGVELKARLARTVNVSTASGTNRARP